MKLNFINFSDPKDYQYFLLIGNEIVLKQEAISSIYLNLKDKGFKEKITLSQDELEPIQEILTKNIGGSLFQENLILHIKHSSGRFPEKIKFILEDKNIFQSANIAIIIESSIEKTPTSVIIDVNGIVSFQKRLQTDFYFKLIKMIATPRSRSKMETLKMKSMFLEKLN